MKNYFSAFKKLSRDQLFTILILALVGFFLLFLISYISLFLLNQDISLYVARERQLQQQITSVKKQLTIAQKEATDLRNQDQYKINQKLMTEIKNIHDTYKQSMTTYEKLLDLKQSTTKTGNFDTQFAQAITYLSDTNYASATAILTSLQNDIQTELDKIAAASAPQVGNQSANAPANNTAPGNGFSQQSVTTDVGTFTIAIIAADLNTTRVIVDTASESDCANNCPVLPLG